VGVQNYGTSYVVAFADDGSKSEIDASGIDIAIETNKNPNGAELASIIEPNSNPDLSTNDLGKKDCSTESQKEKSDPTTRTGGLEDPENPLLQGSNTQGNEIQQEEFYSEQQEIFFSEQ
jgi:hypothetical protein